MAGEEKWQGRGDRRPKPFGKGLGKEISALG